MFPELLSDKSRLQDIYKLRVDAWENSERCDYVNYTLYPSGWFDQLDLSAQHIIIKDCDIIIASIRINFYNIFSEHPYYLGINHIKNIERFRNFAYLSRLVVDHKYRFQGLSNLLFRYVEQEFVTPDSKFIGLDATGFQIQNLKKLGYQEIGTLNTSKLNWIIEPDNQMLLIKSIR